MFRGMFGDALRSPFPKAERDLEAAFQNAEDRSDRLEAWILATGLGLRPAELARLQRVLGTPTYTLGGPQPHAIDRYRDVELTQPVVEAALLLTADVIFRLWQNDSMRLGEPWED